MFSGDLAKPGFVSHAVDPAFMNHKLLKFQTFRELLQPAKLASFWGFCVDGKIGGAIQPARRTSSTLF
jgi:hypothetical protein